MCAPQSDNTAAYQLFSRFPEPELASCSGNVTPLQSDDVGIAFFTQWQVVSDACVQEAVSADTNCHQHECRLAIDASSAEPGAAFYADVLQHDVSPGKG